MDEHVAPGMCRADLDKVNIFVSNLQVSPAGKCVVGQSWINAIELEGWAEQAEQEVAYNASGRVSKSRRIRAGVSSLMPLRQASDAMMRACPIRRLPKV